MKVAYSLQLHLEMDYSKKKLYLADKNHLKTCCFRRLDVKNRIVKWTWQPYLQSKTFAVPSWHLLPSTYSDIPSGQAHVSAPVDPTKQKWLHWTFEDLHGVVTVVLPLPNYVRRKDHLLPDKQFLVKFVIFFQFLFECIVHAQGSKK